MESEQGQDEQAEGPSVIQERLNWKLAWRDDAKVAEGLYAGEAIEEMHELSDAGVLDEFFVFLEEVGILRAFEQVSVPGVKRVLVPTVQFVLLYFLKVLFGSESMNELPRVLFSDLALMELVGFNAQQCENGLTKRGDAQRQSKKKQGPITPQCLAENISKLKQEEMERLFNQMVQLLVGWGLLSGERIVALDGSKLPTPQSYEGCGKVKQTRKVTVKGQKVPLLEQAQRNLGTHAHIGTIVIDRGYLDGEDLWQVHQLGVLFVIVGKANMSVVQDAQGLAKGERARIRERVVRHGHGKTANEERLRTEVVGLEALTSYDSYGAAEQTQHPGRRDYVGQPINAVVVRRWDNRVPKGGGTVYLTNASVSDPFTVFDTYDWRSVIENGLFKEGKHPWHLLRFPQRTEAAVVVHCHFTLLVMGLCTAFRLWQAKSMLVPTAQTAVQANLSTALLGGEGTARWRQRLRDENRDKIIVFIGQAYGIFHLAEFATASAPLRSRLSTGRSSPFWAESLILISKHQ